MGIIQAIARLSGGNSQPKQPAFKLNLSKYTPGSTLAKEAEQVQAKLLSLIPEGKAVSIIETTRLGSIDITIQNQDGKLFMKSAESDKWVAFVLEPKCVLKVKNAHTLEIKV